MTREESILSTGLLGLFAVFSGLDGDALIGAFAGGSLYAMKSDEISRKKRAGYLFISIIAGYYFRNELERIGITATGVSSFIVATSIIAVVTWGYDQIDNLKLSDIIGGKKND